MYYTMTPSFEPRELFSFLKNQKIKFVLNLTFTGIFICVFSFSIAHAAGSSSSDKGHSNADHSKEYYKAVKLIKSEKFDSALPILQALVQDNPNDADIHNYLGFSFRKTGEYDKSSFHYEKALKIDPKHLGALEYQGELYLALGDVEKAKENLVKIDDICFTQCTELRELKKAINSAIN